MMRRSYIIGSLAFAAQVRRATASVTSGPARHNVLPLEFPQEQAIYAFVSVNGVRSLALIDSGATRSIIGTPLAAQLGLSIFGYDAMDAQTHRLQVGRTSGINVVAGQDPPVWLEPGCLDLSGLGGPNGYAPAMIIGLDYIKHRQIDLDFSDLSLAITPLVSGEVPKSAIKVQNGPFGSCCIPVRIGDEQVVAMIDTGSSAPLAVSPELFGRLRTRQTRVSDALIAGAGGLSTETLFSVPSLAIGGEHVPDVPTTSLATWRNPMRAVIGLPVISRYRVRFALGSGWMTLAPDENRAKCGFLRDLTGLGLKFDSDRLTVVHVATGSPAAHDNFKTGEAILAIDGKAVDLNYFKDNSWRWRYEPRMHPVKLFMSAGDYREIRLKRYY